MAQPGELFVMARVPAAVREALMAVLAAGSLDTRLGGALYPLRNWHQSLSDIHAPEAREALRRACARLDAAAFHMPLDRLESSTDPRGRIHWRFVPGGGKPEGLTRLLAGLRARLHEQGLMDTWGHRAHVTASYNAGLAIETLRFPPVNWQVDAIELVEAAGRGADYRYDVVDARPLGPPAASPPTQLGLLG